MCSLTLIFLLLGKKKRKQRNQIILSRSTIKKSLSSFTFKLALSLSTFSSSSFSSPRAHRTCISSAQMRSRYLLPSRSGIRTTLTAFISRTLLGCISLFPWRICGPAGDPPATCWLTSTRCARSSYFQLLTSYFFHIQALSPPKPLKIIVRRHQSHDKNTALCPRWRALTACISPTNWWTSTSRLSLRTTKDKRGPCCQLLPPMWPEITSTAFW